ncbi:MAG: A/G-specific adenine glycosylase [Omnitrophica bacterium RIFCSPLOWO2_12_FULL_44_17]|uniref:Adenine DNA glycosylase n=1 Tax=Candidatus Danuiimicrobium aquiferis TaxID=1801832 RepID=A0A1G1KVM3_9BACT|nr:MAG: A/G-specific adenine glycosylase [Omnitrophica bacterium RIFCSPHIGHO2_02_FULL_45_28]OGW88559.1 MAG: A/G-specific adenine glycosylase [Omnitrophica bacterium RIFCSPHIGHO2_12_FULL_44_12]OGW96822.1 MAG: A/G-specific adenine glycosylase [Omnitrophica bacterium RIFCSPLOWO2_12_FULL_44_17]OGX03824.1 MAG: A/G-specific adenine glycosylase [Omnitrophica bacterium RIFCSPLOWO2_02_FULL_44_11]
MAQESKVNCSINYNIGHVKLGHMKRFNYKSFQFKLLRWFGKNKRRLPWRIPNVDPYRIFVVEIMLQQTQIKTVLPYYDRWLKAFSNIRVLARAPVDRVLKLWEGLGYYSRARNLHKAAKMIVNQFGGHIPSDPALLRQLPGIGRYTAGAIASIAFQKPVPLVDGNVARVFSRIFYIRKDISKPDTIKIMFTIAEKIVPQKKPGDFNQALMELGAIICVPENPRCAICPVRQLCKAYQCGKELNVPVKSRNVAIKEIKMAAAILQNGGRLLVRKRPNHGIWGGLWELPSVIRQKGESAEDAIQQEFKLAYGMQVEIEKKLPVLRHQLTHRTLWIEPVVVHMSSPRPPNIHQNTRRTRCAVWRELANPPSCWAEKREYRRMDLPLTLSLRERVREKAKNLQSARWVDQKTLVLLSFPVPHQKLIREYIS